MTQVVVSLPRPAAHVRAARIAAGMIVTGVELPDMDVLRHGIALAQMCERSLATAIELNNEVDLCEEGDYDEPATETDATVTHLPCVPETLLEPKARHPADNEQYYDWRHGFDVT